MPARARAPSSKSLTPRLRCPPGLEVQRLVTALVPDRPTVRDAQRAQTVADRDQLAVIDGEREVEVAASAVAELLLPGRPQPEPSPLTAASQIRSSSLASTGKSKTRA